MRRNIYSTCTKKDIMLRTMAFMVLLHLQKGKKITLKTHIDP